MFHTVSKMADRIIQETEPVHGLLQTFIELDGLLARCDISGSSIPVQFVLPAKGFQLPKVQEIAHVVEGPKLGAKSFDSGHQPATSHCKIVTSRGPVAHVLDHLVRFHVGLHETDDLLHL